MPCCFAQARMSPLRCGLEAGRGRRYLRPALRACPANGASCFAERGGVLVVQAGLVLRAADGEPHGLAGRATIKIVF
jgi:hypothetical protein